MPQSLGADEVSRQANVPNYLPDRIDKQYLQERGLFGAVYIMDANTYNWPNGVSEIHAVAAAVVDTLVGSIKGNVLESGGDSMPIPAGDSIKGIFTKLKLTSGKVICYLAAPIGVKENSPL